MIYCISDIHGHYNEFINLLKLINFNTSDTLYMLGDAIDRGYDSINCLMFIKNTPNIHMLMGNHEHMMISSLLRNESFSQWHDRNGGNITYEEFKRLTSEKQDEVLTFISGLPYYFDIEVGSKKYLLCHAGLRIDPNMGNENNNIDDIIKGQTIRDLVWIRKEFYENKGLPEHTIIFGHTQAFRINESVSDVKNFNIWHDPVYNDKICIDGGCYSGGVLAALRLDDMKEFYVARY